MNDTTTGQGERLIFILSQPRAGSTLLQRMLASHPDIHTTSEPWLMLPPLTVLHGDVDHPNRSGELAAIGLSRFVETLPGGTQDYHAGVRRMYEYLYRLSADAAGKRYFLDKTPRYTLMLKQLADVFPRARYVVLLRNPLAVLVSVLKTWCVANCYRLHRFRHDLLQAPHGLAGILRREDLQVNRLSYEDLVQTPEPTLESLCTGLDIPFTDNLHRDLHGELPRWDLGDQRRIYEHDSPQADGVDAWQRELGSAQVWRHCHDYLRELGPELIGALGYDYAGLDAILEQNRPRELRRLFTLPLSRCMSPWLEPATSARFIKKHVLYYPRVMRGLGFRGTWQALLKKIRRE